MAELGWTGLHVDEARWRPRASGSLSSRSSSTSSATRWRPAPSCRRRSPAALLVEHAVAMLHVCSAFLPGSRRMARSSARSGSAGISRYGADGPAPRVRPAWVLGAEARPAVCVVCVGDDVALLPADQPGLAIEPQKNVDPSRRVAAVTLRRRRGLPRRTCLRGARRCPRATGPNPLPPPRLRAAPERAPRWRPSTRRSA